MCVCVCNTAWWHSQCKVHMLCFQNPGYSDIAGTAQVNMTGITFGYIMCWLWIYFSVFVDSEIFCWHGCFVHSIWSYRTLCRVIAQTLRILVQNLKVTLWLKTPALQGPILRGHKTLKNQYGADLDTCFLKTVYHSIRRCRASCQEREAIHP